MPSTTELQRRIAELESENRRFRHLIENMGHPMGLYDSERRQITDFLQVVNALHEAMSVIDGEGTLLFANILAAANLAGGAPEEVVGRSIRRFVPAEQAAGLIETYRQVIRTQTPVRREVRVSLQGEERWFLNSMHPLRFGEEKIPAVLSLSHDITDLKHAEQRLARSEERLSLALRGANDGIWDWNVETGEVYFSPRWKEMLGYADHEISHRFSEWERLVTPEGRQAAWDNLNAYLEGRLPGFSCEFQMYHKEGGLVDVLSRAFAVRRSEDGKPVRVIGTHVDITAAKRAEKQLRQEKAFNQRIIDMSPAFIVLNDAEGRVVTMNRAMCSALGYRLEEVAGLDYLTHFVAEEERERLRALFSRRRHVQEISTHVNAVLKRDGGTCTVEWHGTPIRDEGGNLECMLAIGIDITERISLEQQLIQARKMEAIGTLAGGIAHDFNNILGIIIGNTELAMDDVQPWHPAWESLNEIQTAGLRARDVVRQLLTFSRQSPEQRRPLQILPVIRESLKLLRSTIPANVAFRSDLPEACSPILADPTQIHQIIINLFTNAAHALPETGGYIAISVSELELDQDAGFMGVDLPAGRYLRLAVADNGHGIPERELGRIFDPYFTTKDVGKGSGMGLSVVHGIVSRCNGAIRVNSTVGDGSVFEIVFPVVTAAADSQAAPDPAMPTGRERVLLVDDEPAILRMVAQRLTRLGYTVTARGDADMALETFGRTPRAFDLVITDMAMPGMTGDQLLRRIRTIRPGIPTILCTGYSERIEAGRVDMEHISHLMMKPVDGPALAAAIREVMAAR